ncbi:hypothetical protein PHYPSEUDO_009914 [Phytophthora pseudosyringae]|uniref:Uncharacterized protein n=1 Tax=Phytophthora pseudosyringae TaxID=221518 RepID=A0A8T1VBZ7_9STRA|nr:hypothetical protein PHYPSEUDO_009914 [Phytophthora pseudosyringae]
MPVNLALAKATAATNRVKVAATAAKHDSSKKKRKDRTFDAPRPNVHPLHSFGPVFGSRHHGVFVQETRAQIKHCVKELAGRVAALSPLIATREDCKSVHMCMMRDGGVTVTLALFTKKFKAIKARVQQLPLVHYRVPSLALLKRVCTRIMDMSNIVRLSAYAMTLDEVIKAALELHRFKLHVKNCVLIDKR